MMGSDARDVMGLPSAGPPKQTPAKAPKPKVKLPTGMMREVLDLNYEGAPPISIVAPKFKEKPKVPFRPARWGEMPFSNSARKDGLILRHWMKKGDTANTPGQPVTPADSHAASEGDQEDKAGNAIPDAVWAKYNVKVERPKYTDEQYESELKSTNWSREETDYLMDLATEFDLRWPVVGDRYEYQPSEEPKESEDSMAVTIQPSQRSIEELKSRYYHVAAKAMVLRNPLASMLSSEFDIHEKMTKYDPIRETQRKKYAEELIHRTDEEKHEEEMLLKELHRIVAGQEKLHQERNALHDRLEPAPFTSRDAYTGSTMYQSSQGLTQLMQTLLTQSRSKDAEKKEKRRVSAIGGDSSEQPQSATIDRANRHSISSHAGGSAQDKRQSLPPGPQHRQLSRAEREKYGVTYPAERLTGGVTFRQERVTKATQAKSQVQTSRITDALGELGIPTRLPMPTAKVVAEYERLIEGVKELLEVRKVREKVEGEIKVWEMQKEAVEGNMEVQNRGGMMKQEEDDGAEKGKNDNSQIEDDKMDVDSLENTQSETQKHPANPNHDPDDNEPSPKTQPQNQALTQPQNQSTNDTPNKTSNAASPASSNNSSHDNENENENENDDDNDNEEEADEDDVAPASPAFSAGEDVEMDEVDYNNNNENEDVTGEVDFNGAGESKGKGETKAEDEDEGGSTAEEEEEEDDDDDDDNDVEDGDEDEGEEEEGEGEGEGEEEEEGDGIGPEKSTVKGREEPRTTRKRSVSVISGSGVSVRSARSGGGGGGVKRVRK